MYDLNHSRSCKWLSDIMFPAYTLHPLPSLAQHFLEYDNPNYPALSSLSIILSCRKLFN